MAETIAVRHGKNVCGKIFTENVLRSLTRPHSAHVRHCNTCNHNSFAMLSMLAELRFYAMQPEEHVHVAYIFCKFNKK